MKQFDPESFKSTKVLVEPTGWLLYLPPAADRIAVQSEPGFCKGEEPPKYKGVEVRERGSRIYITPYIERPIPVKGKKCLGIGTVLRAVVDLSQDPRQARIYDASAVPPSLRWPE